MPSPDTSSYTRNCILIGIALGFVITYFIGTEYERIIEPAFVNRSTFRIDLYLIRFVLLHVLCASVGLLVCWLSSRLDFISKSDDRAGRIIYIITGFIMAGVLSLIIIEAAHIQTFIRLNDEFAGNASIINFFKAIFSVVVMFFFLIIVFTLTLIALVFILVLTPLTIGISIAGVLCIPRAFIYSTTGHKLRDAAAELERRGTVSPDRVVAGVGRKSTSGTQAVALRKDLDAQLDRMRQLRDRLKVEEQRLTKAMHHDTKRLQGEAEALRIAAEIDTLELRIKLLQAEKRNNTL